MPSPQEFGPYGPNRIYEHRMRADLTQAQLGEKIGKDHSYISYLEYGHRNITPDLMTLLADALGVEEPEIFVRVEDAKR